MIFRKFGFDKVESKRDFEGKLDKAIAGLEEEIASKRLSVQKLMDELKISPRKAEGV
jgi:hypothetical protein